MGHSADRALVRFVFKKKLVSIIVVMMTAMPLHLIISIGDIFFSKLALTAA